MSKLFKPMFKKKGKEKEDDFNEEDSKKKNINEDGTKRKSGHEDGTKRKSGHEDGTRAKIRMKAEKMKDALRSPVKSSSPSLPLRTHKSKRKVKGEDKKMSVNGKLSTHSPEEAEVHSVEDFYIDEEGSVIMGHQDNKRASNPFEDDESITDDEQKIIDHQSPAELTTSISSEEEKLDSSEISLHSTFESEELIGSELSEETNARNIDTKNEVVKTEGGKCVDPAVQSEGDGKFGEIENEGNKSEEEDGNISERLISERTFTSTQDSDEDFDSAQEDWEEDNSRGSHKRGSRDTFGQVQEVKEIPSSVNEATNTLHLDCENAESSEGFVRSPSSGSSEYEDILSLQDSSHVGETSDDKVPHNTEDSGRMRKKSGSEKLVRKLSGLSTTSSDAFNEELDDLLDEELDRLSEGEEMEAEKEMNEIPAEEVNNVISSPAKIIEQQSGAIVNTNPNKITDDKEPVSNDILNEDAVEDKGEKPVTDNVAIISTGDSGSNDKTAASDKQESSTSGSHLTPEDHVKDSGYYSLPVSPNPGAVIRASNESDQGGKVVDDSFGDSEEDGMITPPCETPAKEKMTERLNIDVNNSVVTDDKKNYEAVNNPQKENNDDNASCVEATESKETPKNENKSCTSADVSSSEVKKASLSPKQDVNLKVVIPNPSQLDKKEDILSPKCGSPTKSRFKSPLKEMDESYSRDPIGDRFLNEAVLLSHDEAEARLAQRRAARAEARELRLRELEKQQQDQENEEEKQFTSPSFAEPSPRAPVATRTSVGRTSALNSTGQYSRRSSEDSTTDESALPANVREMRAELKELDEKFRKAMITNAQLDNEKSTLTYEVELIKDKYTELEEAHTQLNKEHRKKCTEYEQLRKVSTKLQEEVKILRGMLQERDQLIQEYGLVVVGEEEENGEVPPEPDEFADMDDLTPRKIAVKKVLLSQEAAELLEKGAAKGSLDVRLKKFGEEKNDLEDEVRRLKLELEEERNNNRRRENGLDYEKQKEQSKTVNEYKFRVQKAEAEVLTLQANVLRLDALSTRYKTQSEELEKSEEELKLEKRKLQRELRDAQSRLEEIETTNNHLIRRFDKLKNARSTLLKDLSQDPV